MRGAWLIPIAGVALVVPSLASFRLNRSGTGVSAIALASPPPASQPAPAPDAGRATPQEPEPSPLAGLDVNHLRLQDGALVAPTDRGSATLTLDPDLQKSTQDLMRRFHLPEAAVVLMDVPTGRLLVYASHVENGPARDLCAEAVAPSASVFKIVTAAALIEDAHLGPDTKQCYSGGEERIVAANLVDDPRRDRWCTTLAGAFGRSINTVFARLASKHLDPAQLETMAHRFGYGEPVGFDLPVAESSIRVPADPLEFARTAAGFWNSTLSPVAAIELSATVAREGEAQQPTLVDKVVSPAGVVLWSAAATPVRRRAIAPDIAEQIAGMMTHTVTDGTSYRAFHDGRGASFLPDISVAGKTGTLTDAPNRRYYTWFTGFAPLRPSPTTGQVAVAVLVVNGPSWQVKANVIARDVLRGYFAAHGAAGVTQPSLRIARRRRR